MDISTFTNKADVKVSLDTDAGYKKIPGDDIEKWLEHIESNVTNIIIRIQNRHSPKTPLVDIMDAINDLVIKAVNEALFHELDLIYISDIIFNSLLVNISAKKLAIHDCSIEKVIINKNVEVVEISEEVKDLVVLSEKVLKSLICYADHLEMITKRGILGQLNELHLKNKLLEQDIDLYGLHQLTKLTIHVKYKGNIKITNAPLLECLILDNVESLQLEDCNTIKHMEIKHCENTNVLDCYHFPNLEELVLNNCETDVLHQLIAPCLRRIKFASYDKTKLHYDILHLTHFPKLEKVEIFNAQAIKELDLKGLCFLQELNINIAVNMSNVDIEDCPMLKKIDLYCCPLLKNKFQSFN